MARVLVVLLLASLPLIAQEQRVAAPHIVVLLADDLGFGDVGFHGSAISTPHIDALASRGVRLEQFYAQPVCSPTRGALLTGRYPIRLGLQVGVVRPWAEHGLPLEERTLANTLGECGYATAICGKWHLGHATRDQLPTRRGFDHQYGHYNGALDYFTHVRDGGFDWHEDDKVNHDEGYTTDLIADKAIAILAGHDPARPLFLYVPFNAPHSPMEAPKEWIEEYAQIEDRQRRTYAAMVACLDAAVGRILAALDEHGYARDKTLVLFLSDNGGIVRFGSNGPLRGEKGQVETRRFWQWNRYTPVGTCNAATRDGDWKLVRPVINEAMAVPDGQWLRVSMYEPEHFIEHGIIRDPDPPRDVPPPPPAELYHITEDPLEQRNLASEHPDVARRLLRELETWFEEVDAERRTIADG